MVCALGQRQSVAWTVGNRQHGGSASHLSASVYHAITQVCDGHERIRCAGYRFRHFVSEEGGERECCRRLLASGVIFGSAAANSRTLATATQGS